MRTAHALTTAAALTLALAACGNGDDGKATNTTAAPSSASVTRVSTAAPSSPSASNSASASASGSSSSSASASSATPSSGATSSAPAPTASASNTSADAGPSSSAQGSGQGGATATASASAGEKDGTATAYAYVAKGWSQFTTPSGRNWCNVIEGAVGCQIPQHVSAQHHGANFVTITSQGVGFLTGDAGMDTDGTASRWTTSVPGAPTQKKDGTAVLGYGSTLRAGDTTCKSTVNGVTCTNSVASFTVNTSGVTMTGARTADR